MKYRYKGKIYEGSRNEIVYQLRLKEKLTQQKIANLMGVTKSAISLVLTAYGLGGHLTYPELDNRDLFLQMSEEEICKKFRIPLYLVSAARKKHTVRRTRINLDRRRKNLAAFLFGKNFIPGPLFCNTISSIAETLLTPKRAKLIIDFLGGRRDKHVYWRIYRTSARNRLKEIIKSMENRDWEEEGVVIISNSTSR